MMTQVSVLAPTFLRYGIARRLISSVHPQSHRRVVELTHDTVIIATASAKWLGIPSSLVERFRAYRPDSFTK
jgi:hypothetical protein